MNDMVVTAGKVCLKTLYSLATLFGTPVQSNPIQQLCLLQHSKSITQFLSIMSGR